jgi:hypothetical protein
MPQPQQPRTAREPQERKQATHGETIARRQDEWPVQFLVQRRLNFNLVDGSRLEVERSLAANHAPRLGASTCLHARIRDRVGQRRTAKSADDQEVGAALGSISHHGPLSGTRAIDEAKIPGSAGWHTQMIVGGARSNHRSGIPA